MLREFLANVGAGVALASALSAATLVAPPALAPAATTTPGARVAAQGGARSLVITGHVTGLDEEPIEGALVTGTSVGGTPPGTILGSTRTSASGIYRLALDSVSRAVLVRVHMLGFAPDSDLVLLADVGDSTEVSFRLRPAPRDLPPVSSVAERPRPRRAGSRYFPPPGADQVVVDRTSQLTGDFTGDLASALATVPGVNLTPSTSGGSPVVSAFGLDAEQNSVTLNGFTVLTGVTPRDGMRAAVQMATYDPRYGRGAGLQVDWRMPGGTSEFHNALHLTADGTALQWTTPAAAQLGTRYQQTILSGTASGPISFQRRYYSLAFQVTQRSSDVFTLASATPLALSAVGLSPDSAVRARTIAATVGLPGSGSVPNHRSLSASGIARIDFLPGAVNGIADDSNPSLYVLAGGALGRDDRSGGSTTAMPTTLSESRHHDGFVGLVHATFLKSLLTESKLMYSSQDGATIPLSALPAADVQVESALSEGGATLLPLRMGGDGGTASDYRTDGWQFTNESTLESWSGAHRFSSYVDVTSQQLSASHRFNTLGTFSFNSLADLESGNANRFTRSFGATTAQSRVFDATLGLGDIFAQNRHGLAPGSGYEPADGLTLQYGIRADFQRFSHSALYNPLVDSLLGVRTDHVPNSFAIQPMLGFVWNRGEYRAESGGALFIDTRSSLSGGIRLYRSAVPPDVVLGTQDETGLPVDERRLECVGDAVPMPDWPEYAVSSTAIPSECVQPAPSGSAVAPTPHVSLFAPDYAPTESWRGELRWRWRASAHLSGNVGSIYSIGAHRASVIDLNFDPQVDFRLQNEDGRPVYVPASGISSLGAAPLSGSRQFGSFGSVIEQRSDLKSTQAMLSAGLTYQIGATEFQGPQDPAVRRVSAAISATYTFARDRRQIRGFDATTAADPRSTDWVYGPTPEHTILVALTGRVEDWFSLSIFGRITSGFRYTPLVSGDVNGDGYLNDRAFVFDPARVTDSTVARGMAALLSHASPSARSCLEAQLGRIAAHNSCVGPWGISVGTVALDLDSHRIGLGNRGRLTLYFGNPLGGLDQLLHGSNNLHGWGQAAAPDPTLLMVTGFDPTRERFQYAVNDRFGSARATRLMFRPPFRLTIDFRGDVSPNLESQYIELFMRNAAAAAGGSPTRAKLKTYMLRWATRGDLDPILGRADSVQLTAAQRQSLQALGRHLMRFRDSTYSDLADFFVSHRGAYGSASVRRRWHSSIAASVREAFAASRETRALLSEDQRKWLREHRLGSLIDQTTTWLERTLERPFVAPR